VRTWVWQMLLCQHSALVGALALAPPLLVPLCQLHNLPVIVPLAHGKITFTTI
jgi:hypothetical protein